jgi:hypothetical protein
MVPDVIVVYIVCISVFIDKSLVGQVTFVAEACFAQVSSDGNTNTYDFTRVMALIVLSRYIVYHQSLTGYTVVDHHDGATPIQATTLALPAQEFDDLTSHIE